MASTPILPIPKVPKQLYGLLGNLPDIDPSFFIKSVWQLAELHGEIFELDVIKTKLIILSTHELIKDVLNDNRFEKVVTGPLIELRSLVKDGLFTAYSHEENWHKAHRILMPVFGPMAIRKMFDEQLDIASQMILKWDRQGPKHEIDCADDFTRLAFDTIALCAFNYRFNNFYADKMHPFATQMADVLTESGKRANRTSLETHLRRHSEMAFRQNIKSMQELCDEVVQDRITNPQPEVHDLLNNMLNTSDPVTGEKLSAENIRYQMATFLIAGHETTSGTLAFLFYHLLRNPETYHKAQQEVDTILGDDALSVNHLPKFKYIDACIKETLRFQGPIGAVVRHAKNDDIIAGKYAVKPDSPIICNLNGLHHDPKVWGDDAGIFRPERMLDFGKIVPGAWKPFGSGMRACIGQAFATQEMIINVVLILQRFQVEMANPSYNLELKSTLTLKPLDFNMRVKRRPNKTLMVGLQMSSQQNGENLEKDSHQAQRTNIKHMTIIYGSNAGTCKAYADDLSGHVEKIGFSTTVKPMDSCVEDLPKDEPLVIITPSYEGNPADNAKKFISWLEIGCSKKQKLEGTKFALFGVGNSEWISTFHKVPKLVDKLMTQMEAKSIIEAGFVDVKTDTVGPWEEWREQLLQKLCGTATKETASIGMKVKLESSSLQSTAESKHISLGIVKENILLADSRVGPAKMHMEVELPEGISYRSGDYLVILPSNHRENVRRVLSRFRLRADDTIEISDTNKSFLKTKTPLPLFAFVASKVELQTPITLRQLTRVCATATDKREVEVLRQLCTEDAFSEKILAKRYSILDILEEYPSCCMEFAEYLDMLQPLTPRQYSISSSPLALHEPEKATASITYDVHECPAWSGHHRTFHGVASSFLADLKAGSQISCFIRATNARFHLPSNSETPIVMVATGSGIAPMRGFLQERAAIQAAGSKQLGPALLYFGVRDIDGDFIYRKELEHWQSQGIVSLRLSFSQKGDPDNHYRHTDDRIYAERDELAKLVAQGAKIFVCGSAKRVGKSTADVFKKMWLEWNPSKTEGDAADWLDTQRETRYVSDVFD